MLRCRQTASHRVVACAHCKKRMVFISGDIASLLAYFMGAFFATALVGPAGRWKLSWKYALTFFFSGGLLLLAVGAERGSLLFHIYAHEHQRISDYCFFEIRERRTREMTCVNIN